MSNDMHVGQAGPNAIEERRKLISMQRAEAMDWLDSFNVPRMDEVVIGQPLHAVQRYIAAPSREGECP